MTTQLYVCFLENDLSLMESHWLNRMAAKLAPKSSNSPKIHVELFFPDNRQDESENVAGHSNSIDTALALLASYSTNTALSHITALSNAIPIH